MNSICLKFHDFSSILCDCPNSSSLFKIYRLFPDWKIPAHFSSPSANPGNCQIFSAEERDHAGWFVPHVLFLWFRRNIVNGFSLWVWTSLLHCPEIEGTGSYIRLPELRMKFIVLVPHLHFSSSLWLPHDFSTFKTIKLPILCFFSILEIP